MAANRTLRREWSRAIDTHDASAYDALAAKVNELAQLCARLTEENAELRAQVSGPAPEKPQAPEGGRRDSGLRLANPISRRGMGKVIGAAAVGVVGATAIAELATHHPAHEDDAATIADVSDVSAEAAAREEHAAQGTSSASVVSAGMSSTAALVNASNLSSGPGVQGTSKSGRGGVFGGGAAQVHLSPGGSSHPRSGEMGDLYADKRGRLWYCTKSGSRASWKQIG
jgi:hypothetical protein